MMRGQFWSEMMFVMEPIIIVIIIIIIWYLLLIWAAVISTQSRHRQLSHSHLPTLQISTTDKHQHQAQQSNKNTSIQIENCLWPHLFSWSPQPGLMRSACSNQSPLNASLISAGRGRSYSRPVKDNGDLVSVYLHIFYFSPPFLVAKAVNYGRERKCQWLNSTLFRYLRYYPHFRICGTIGIFTNQRHCEADNDNDRAVLCWHFIANQSSSPPSLLSGLLWNKLFIAGS